jgi:penicillin amidase
VSPKRSSTRAPILANDLHLFLSAPSLWYQLNLSCPDWNVSGVSLPGIPLVIVGRNNALAWGFTNAMLDDADVYIDEFDSTLTTYMFEGRLRPVEARVETIYVGNTDSLLAPVRETLHGPVLDEIHPPRLPARSAGKRFFLTFRWTGFEASDELYAFYLMNKARDSQEFEAALRFLAAPGQNVVFSDTAGNIGQWVTGRVPVRTRSNPMFPLPGWMGEHEWKGYVPFNQLPRIWNPPEGFVATANNPFVDERFPTYVSELWEPSSRIIRIRELMASDEHFGVKDFERFQMDVQSPHGREFAGHMLRALWSDSLGNPAAESALEYLRNWDYRFSKDNVAPTIVAATFVKFVRNVFEDELGDSLVLYYTMFSAMPNRIASQLLGSDSSAWFDDVTTGGVETKDEILRKSLYDALRELEEYLGTDTKLWRWGSLHAVTFAHPFGKQKPLDKVFNVGPFGISGSGTTVHKTDFRFSDPFNVFVGSSVRQVIDLGSRSSLSSVITTGQSGQVFNEHYDDQNVLWLNGEYHTILFDWDEISGAPWDQLVLKPQ